jgi:predicted RNase H-like HicB family nuclease
MTNQTNQPAKSYNLPIEIEQLNGDKWIAEIPDLPGVLSYGKTQKEAIINVKSLALRSLADDLEAGINADLTQITFIHPEQF